MKSCLLTLLAGLASSIAYGADGEFTKAVATYVSGAAAARSAYLSALQQAATKFQGVEGVAGVTAVLKQRAEFLLGIASPESFIEQSAQYAGPDLQAATAAYASEMSRLRQELAGAYDSQVTEAIAAQQLDRAMMLANELKALQAGTFHPTLPGRLGGTTVTPGRLVYARAIGKSNFIPLTSTQFPDELQITFAEQRVQIEGTCQVDTLMINGTRCGHFGKIVVFPSVPTAAKATRGLFQIREWSREAHFGFGVIKNTYLTTDLLLDELKLNVVYAWAVQPVEKT